MKIVSTRGAAVAAPPRVYLLYIMKRFLRTCFPRTRPLSSSCSRARAQGVTLLTVRKKGSLAGVFQRFYNIHAPPALIQPTLRAKKYQFSTKPHRAIHLSLITYISNACISLSFSAARGEFSARDFPRNEVRASLSLSRPLPGLHRCPHENPINGTAQPKYTLNIRF